MAEAEGGQKKSISIRGNNGLAHIVLAAVHLLNRRHDEALAECYRAVELRPNCLDRDRLSRQHPALLRPASRGHRPGSGGHSDHAGLIRRGT